MPPNSPVSPFKLFRTFARNVPLSDAMGPMGMFLIGRSEKAVSTLDIRTREIVIDRVCARSGCEYEWGLHIAIYRKQVNFSDQQIYSLAYGGPEDACWGERDRALMRMVDELHDTCCVSDPTWKELASQYSQERMLELLVLAGWYHVISYVANGARTEKEEWAPGFPKK